MLRPRVPARTPRSPGGLAEGDPRARPEDGRERWLLTAEEIAAIDLRGVGWVALSACQTGLGKIEAGEGILGLRHAFHEAGARSVATRWRPVEDEAARRWMRRADVPGGLSAEKCYPSLPMSTRRIHRKRAPPALPSDPKQAHRQLMAAWTQFITESTLSPAVRPVIAERWMRSRELSVDPYMMRAPSVRSLESIQSALVEDDFARAGREVLDGVAPVFDGMGHVGVLADPQGTILHLVGHHGIEEELVRGNIAPGAGWSEDLVGPNGIATPISLGRPEVVFGPEHYCEGWQHLVCYGAPVIDGETGEVLGGVDITGPAQQAQAHVLALAISMARSVQQSVSVARLQRRYALLAAGRQAERRYPSTGILVVDERGRVIDANHAALQLLGLDREGLEGSPQIERLLPELDPARGAAGKPIGLRDGLVAPGSRIARPFRYNIEPVLHGRRSLGRILYLSGTVPRGHARKPGPPPIARSSQSRYSFEDILGNSAAMRAAMSQARAAATAHAGKPVLLVGETGTGKELVAHAIHAGGPRAGGPFVAVHCGALSRELIESDLFGHSPGAFTGAPREGRTGRFEAAHGGSIFLDEIDSMPMDLQVKFLRVLEEGEVVKLGSSTPFFVDVRLITATSSDLRQLVEANRFRMDLLHRLCVHEILLPPLRERTEDIQLLVETFLERESRLVGRPAPTVAGETIRVLMAYPWPGNVRELRNLCSLWAQTAEGRILPEHLPASIREPSRPLASKPTLRQSEEAVIRQALAECGGNVRDAAAKLGVAKTTIYRHLKKWAGV